MWLCDMHAVLLLGCLEEVAGKEGEGMQKISENTAGKNYCKIDKCRNL